MSNVKVGASVRHRITGATGQIVAGPRRASRGMRWVMWDGLGGVRPSAPRQSSSNVLIVEDAVVRCQWFLRCENPATTTRSHPVLGAVPVCERCAGRAGQ